MFLTLIDNVLNYNLLDLPMEILNFPRIIRPKIFLSFKSFAQFFGFYNPDAANEAFLHDVTIPYEDLFEDATNRYLEGDSENPDSFFPDFENVPPHRQYESNEYRRWVPNRVDLPQFNGYINLDDHRPYRLYAYQYTGNDYQGLEIPDPNPNLPPTEMTLFLDGDVNSIYVTLLRMRRDGTLAEQTYGLYLGEKYHGPAYLHKTNILNLNCDRRQIYNEPYSSSQARLAGLQVPYNPLEPNLLPNRPLYTRRREFPVRFDFLALDRLNYANMLLKNAKEAADLVQIRLSEFAAAEKLLKNEITAQGGEFRLKILKELVEAEAALEEAIQASESAEKILNGLIEMNPHYRSQVLLKGVSKEMYSKFLSKDFMF